MSDLQIVLIVLGAIIIAGVVVYNWMQERKLRTNITEEFLVPQKDVLTEDFYIDADAYVDKALADIPNKIKEKLIEPEAAPVAEIKVPYVDTPTAQTGTIEPVEDTISAPQMPEIEPSKISADETFVSKKIESTSAKYAENATSPLPDETHPQIDLTAFLYATKSISVEALKTMADNIADNMGVPMMLHGLDKDSKWHAIKQNVPKETYKQIACSLQLADRSGPVSKHILHKFQFAVENMGLELNAHVEWQGQGDATQRAIDLDKFCMEVDQLVSVHLMQGEAPVHGTKFKGLAEASSMKLSNEGKFCFFAGSNLELPQFVLINADNQPFTAEGLRNSVVKGATFQIEIPKVTNCEQVFNQMIAVAQKMTNSLGARMVDDNQKPLGDLQIEKIRQQLKVIHATMVARGVMPGSPSSARLFN